MVKISDASKLYVGTSLASKAYVGTNLVWPVGVDPTTAWVNAVVAAGGTVSSGRQTLVGNLITGLQTDGVWAKLDRFWVLAAENSKSALIDMKALAVATPTGGPAFTADVGYSCTAATATVGTTFNYAVNGVAFQQNSAHLSVWNLTDGPSANGTLVTGAGPSSVNIYAKYVDGNIYSRICDGSGGVSIGDCRGFIIGNRSSLNDREIYQNGTTLVSASVASTAVPSETLLINERVVSEVSAGGSLSSTQQLAFYNRLLTYMAAVDPSTAAWAAAVVAAGGTVSSSRKVLVYNLITGLKADGVWAKLDCLWVLAAENAQSALVDIVSVRTATAAGASSVLPAFTADRGYTGNSAYASNLSNAGTNAKFLQNSACMFVWNNRPVADTAGIVGFGVSYNDSHIIPEYSANGTCYWNINNSGVVGNTHTVTKGLYSANRSGSTTAALYINGVSTFTTSDPSVSPRGEAIVCLGCQGGSTWSDYQASAFGAGGSLDATEQTALYNRLRTYMTAVGVP